MTPGLVLGLHLFTAHLGGHGLEAVNPGVYVRTEDGLTAGVFRNSYCRTSAYAGLTLETADRRFALTVGGVTGYRTAKVMPLAVPSVRLPITGDLAARLSFVPKLLKGGYAGLHLSVERSF